MEGIMAKPKIIKFKEGGVLIYNKRKHIKHTGAYIGFTVGSYHNGKDKGAAHFLEHMLFTGTKDLSKDDFSKEVAKTIPGINAVTTSNYTAVNFYRTNELLDPAFKLVSDMLLNTNLTEENMKTEIGVIQEELRRRENMDEDNIWAQSQKTYGKKPSVYGIDTYDRLGTFEGLKNYKLKTLIDFKNKHYNLNNFVACVTTALPLFKIKKMIRKYFIEKLSIDKNYKKNEILYDINRKENLNIAITKKNKLSMELTFKLKKGIDETKFDYSYNILSSWIGAGFIASFLTKRLRDEELVYSASTTISKNHNEFLFLFNIDTGKEKFNKVISCINWAINIAKKELITAEKINEIKNNYLYARDEKQPVETRYKAYQLMNKYVEFKKFDKSLTRRQYKKQLDLITPETINKLANELFSPKTPLYITLLGNIDAKDYPTHKELKKIILKDDK